ncbi:UbiA family prenyltransferase [Streptomyces sp. NPDC058953]|uniref:UbiA family prenyltransferase n=1 Tax=unclassified Streptomyces TaxID=2593676 RepID=UPI0036A9F758
MTTPLRLMGRMLYAHLQTWRPYTLCYPGLVSLAGALLPGADRPGSGVGVGVVAFVAPTAAWIGAHYLCDWFDRDLDATGRPQRPIPSGRLSPRIALATGLAAIAVSLGALAAVDGGSALLMVWILGGVVTYALALKGRGLYGNVLRGGWMAAVLLAGVLLTHDRPPLVVLPLALSFAAHDAAHNLLGTLRDIDGDRAGGVGTYAVRHGPRAAVRMSAWLYGAAMASAVVAAVMLPIAAFPGYPVLLAAAVVCGSIAYAPALRAGSAVPPETALATVRPMEPGRLLLAGAVLSVGVGFGPAAVVVGAAAGFSLVVQGVMRGEYDLPPGAVSRG